MKGKWYRSNVTKAVLVITAHILVIAMTASLVWIVTYPAIREELFAGTPAKKYEDSRNFIDQMLSYSRQAVTGVGAKGQFETDGKYDPDKLVDIEQYYDTNSFNGKNKNGLAYRLGDLLEWVQMLNNGETSISEELQTSARLETAVDTEKSARLEVASDTEIASDTETATDTENQTENIIVCKNSDEGYHYYTVSSFYKAIESGKLKFVMEDESEDLSAQNILSRLLSSDGLPEDVFLGIQDAEGKMVYTDCWVYDGMRMEEPFSPDGAKNVLEVVNNDSRWNGRLDDLYSMLESVIYTLNESYNSYKDANENIEEGDTNFFYIYADTGRQKIYTNRTEYGDYKKLEANLEKMKELGKYVIVNPKLADFESNLKDVDASNWRNLVKYSGISEEDFLFAAVVDTSYPVQDVFYNENQLYARYGSGARGLGAFACVAAVLIIVCVLWLCGVAGRSDRDSELHLNAFDRWKTEFAAAAIILAWVMPTLFITLEADWGFKYAFSRAVESVVPSSNTSYLADSMGYIVGISMLAVYTLSMFLIGFLSLIRRIKAKTLWSNSILKLVLTIAGDFFRNLNCLWKKMLVYGAFLLAHWFVIAESRTIFKEMLFVIDVIAGVYLIYTAIGQDRIVNGLKKIAQGEVTYEIPVDKMLSEEKNVAQKINSMREGLEKAVDESVKSERLKTDLITNVSHDIKTPLTSIINYVGLLKQENFEDPKIQRYIEVLEQKSQRLKTLTEDVVEASKISSGNIVLKYMNVNFAEMIAQVSGEFEEKFEARRLKEVLILPEKEVVVSVDGRRMWRVLANIYSNASKYAMEGTRVYAELLTIGGEAVFSLKNISDQALNISADELTERFIRGDISRSTEGSGLGLSIAQTLTRMQGGKFELYLDGDLFKVTIKFPLVYPEAE